MGGGHPQGMPLRGSAWEANLGARARAHKGCPYGDLLAGQLGGEGEGRHKGCPYGVLLAGQLGGEGEGTHKGSPTGFCLQARLGARARAPTRGAPTGICLQARLGVVRAPTRGAPTGFCLQANWGRVRGHPQGVPLRGFGGPGWALGCLRWITLGTSTKGRRRDGVGGALRGRSPRTREGRLGPTAQNCSSQWSVVSCRSRRFQCLGVSRGLAGVSSLQEIRECSRLFWDALCYLGMLPFRLVGDIFECGYTQVEP